MRFLNAKARITLGLVGIVISLVMLAFFVKIIPDKHSADIQRRTVLAETIAIYSTALVKTARVQRLKDDFTLLAERNSDLQSIALRAKNGKLLVATEQHNALWQDMLGEYSIKSQVKVPIWSGKEKWGQLELRFSPLFSGGVWGMLNRPAVKLVLLLGSLCFLIFYFYLGKVLRQLDPSQAIPGRVRSALDTMAEGLLILDRKEQIVLANQAFSSMVNKPAEKLLGFRAGELPWFDEHGEQISKAKRPWVLALAAGKVWKDSIIRLQLPDESSRTFKTNCSPVLGDKGKYAGVLISFDDITELEQKERELISSKLEAEEANRAKSSFLANMSHEIRTPMNAILGFTEILKRGYVKNEHESLKYLNTIHSSGKNLLELINDILDLSKVESGRLEVEKMAIQPYSIIHEVVEMLRVKADENGIGLNFKVLNEMPETIETDPVRLRQIAFNLIGNSIKFTEKGEVSVSCRLDNASSQTRLIIDITDTGIGMTEESQKKIFDPFTQADNSVSRRFGGTGLGLAISQRFAQALGGDIWVKSKLGEGSTFSVALATGPLDNVKFLTPNEIDELQQAVESVTSSRWKFSQANILVVDDGSENRELIRLLLEEAGLSVVEAENGQEGLDQAGRENFAVILMDINMPVMDGYTAATKMRATGIDVPIVALTANAMMGDEEKCLAAGYTHYLSKPINIDLFMDLMAQLLGGKKLESENDEQGKRDVANIFEVAGPVENSPIYSKLPVKIEKFRSIVIRFVERLQQILAEMDTALDAQNYSELATLAHTLKGSGGTVGFDVFTEPATELEQYAKESRRADAAQVIDTLHALASRIVVDGSEEKKQSIHSTVIAPRSAVQSGKVEDRSKQRINSRLATNLRMHSIIDNFIVTLHEKISLMDDALQNEDFAELANLAHWLKGAGGTVGFDVFTKVAETFENYAKVADKQKTSLSIEEIKTISNLLVSPGATVENVVLK